MSRGNNNSVMSCERRVRTAEQCNQILTVTFTLPLRCTAVCRGRFVTKPLSRPAVSLQVPGRTQQHPGISSGPTQAYIKIYRIACFLLSASWSRLIECWVILLSAQSHSTESSAVPFLSNPWTRLPLEQQSEHTSQIRWWAAA